VFPLALLEVQYYSHSTEQPVHLERKRNLSKVAAGQLDHCGAVLRKVLASGKEETAKSYTSESSPHQTAYLYHQATCIGYHFSHYFWNPHAGTITTRDIVRNFHPAEGT
jgi:hypothetical protein